MKHLNSWRGEKALRCSCSRRRNRGLPPSAWPLSLAPPCPPSYNLRQLIPGSSCGQAWDRGGQGWLLLVGLVLGQVQAFPALSERMGPIWKSPELGKDRTDTLEIIALVS